MSLAYTEFANAICHKLQVAAAEMVKARITANELTDQLPLANVFAGIGIGDLEATRVVCLCQRATPQHPWEGNWQAELSVVVVAPFADIASVDEYHALAGQIFAFFFQERETVCSRLSNADVKFTAQFIVPTGASWDIDRGEDGKDATFVSEQSFQVMCSGSVIS